MHPEHDAVTGRKVTIRLATGDFSGGSAIVRIRAGANAPGIEVLRTTLTQATSVLKNRCATCFARPETQTLRRAGRARCREPVVRLKRPPDRCL